MIPPPLFIFGVARSGTNLLARMLASHPHVEIALDPLLPLMKALRNAIVAARAPERVAHRFDENSAFQDYYFVPDGPELLDTVMGGDLDTVPALRSPASLIAAIRRRAALESAALAQRLEELSGDTFRELVDGVLEAIAFPSATVELAWVGCKEVWTVEFIPVLARAYPHARFIVHRRDPRAVIASLEALAAQEPSQAAHTVSYMRHWRKEAAVLTALVGTPALTGRLYIQHYEALVSRPEEEVQSLCDFLDLEFDPSMTTLADRDGFVWRGNSSFGDLDGISARAASRWRDVADYALVRAVEFHCAPEMRLCGYEPTSRSPEDLDETVRGYVLAAHASPGTWRSDTGNPERDLAGEIGRWAMITGDLNSFCEQDVRRHFLFEPCLRAIRNLWQNSPTRAMVGADERSDEVVRGVYFRTPH